MQCPWMARDNLIGKAAGVLASLLLLPATASAFELTGTVRSESAEPVSQAMITVEGLEGVGPWAISVFSDEQGKYRTPDLGQKTWVNKLKIQCRKLGFESVKASEPAKASSAYRVEFTMKPVENIAAAVPASAWLSLTPDTPDRQLTILQCAQCHGFPPFHVSGPKYSIGADSHAFVESLRGSTEQEREAAWRMMIRLMRLKFYAGPDGTDPNQIPIAQRTDPYTSFLTKAHEDGIARFLGKYFPVDLEKFPLKDYDKLAAPLAVNGRTVIREYKLPDTSFVREVAMVKGNPYIWGADLQKNRLMRLDPKDGSTKWYPVPFEGPIGPHTIVPGPGENGKQDLWVSPIMGDRVIHFNPWTEKYVRLYELPKGANPHDFSNNWKFEAGLDYTGKLWGVSALANSVVSLNLETGKAEQYPVTPPVEGASMAAVYGMVITSDGKRVCYSQLFGSFGCFNTETKKLDHAIDFPGGTGPRRMAIDENDTVWLPLYGAGQILQYDAKVLKEVARYDLPDRAAAPYAVSWDPVRKVVWVSTTSSDLIYRFDPKTKGFAQFPLPRGGAYLRHMPRNPDTGDLLLPYSVIPTSGGPSVVAVLDPGDDNSLPKGN